MQKTILSESTLSDSLQRTISYLRLSVTDRCNLRCLYCQSNAKTNYIPHDSILRYEEMLHMIRIFSELGVKKVRLTGGEPLVRKDCDKFLIELRRLFPNMDLRITSNGTILESYISVLKKISLNCVNISIDTFDKDVYKKITGQDLLRNVLASLDALLKAQIRVKINAVALRGITDKALDDFIHVARNYSIDVRFIEFMPMGQDTIWSKEHFLSVGELISRASERVRLIPSEENSVQSTRGPARMFSLEGSKGRLGFISPLSNHYCQTCNRLRLTSDGMLRLCLYDDKEYNIREMLRNPSISEDEIRRYIVCVCQNKPLGVRLLEERKTGQPVAKKLMSGIGG